MRRVFVFFLISQSLTFGQAALAGSYSEDLEYLKNALKISRFSDRDLPAFQNPSKGQSQFRLDAKRAPWAGNFFPMKDGGIAYRWQDPQPKHLNIAQTFTKEDFLRMTPEQINKLSPSEKYDLMMGDYNFSATKHELVLRGPLRQTPVQNWEGFCNGCRAAGILLPEPNRAVSLKNPDGIHILFNIADLKALAGSSYFYVEKYAQLGSPSRDSRGQSQPNAAVFDLALRYFVGEKRKSFVVDSHLGTEIWNESVVGYQRRAIEAELTFEEKSQRPWAVSKVEVRLAIETLGEISIHASDQPTKEEVARGARSGRISSGYVLYVDSEGKALDGVWKNASGDRGIDFAWFPGGKGTDSERSNGEVGNPWLDFSKIRKLFIRSARPISCKEIFI